MSKPITLKLFALRAALELSMHKRSNFHSAAEENEALASINQFCMEANVDDAPTIEKIEEVIAKINSKMKWLKPIEAVEPATCLEYKIKKDEHKDCRLRVEKVGHNGLALLVFKK